MARPWDPVSPSRREVEVRYSATMDMLNWVKIYSKLTTKSAPVTTSSPLFCVILRRKGTLIKYSTLLPRVSRPPHPNAGSPRPAQAYSLYSIQHKLLYGVSP